MYKPHGDWAFKTLKESIVLHNAFEKLGNRLYGDVESEFRSAASRSLVVRSIFVYGAGTDLARLKPGGSQSSRDDSGEAARLSHANGEKGSGDYASYNASDPPGT